jgi:hypothetical protein
MHRTFGIPEILDLIFAELQNPEPLLHPRDHSRSRKDFAALTRTCKTFQSPALDFLWREQETLVNVLKCLPAHLWEEKLYWTHQG